MGYASILIFANPPANCATSKPHSVYASDCHDVDGIIVPAKRRVYAYQGDYQLVKEPLLVAIDMGEITLL
jgi:hypothetical protein